MRLNMKTSAVVLLVMAAAAPTAVLAGGYSGFYIGGSLGLFGSAVIESENNSGTVGDGTVLQHGVDESLFTRQDLHIGYGQEIGDWYLGVEVGTNIGTSLDDRVQRYSDFAGGGEEEIELDYGNTVGLRAGRILSPQTLVYVKVARNELNVEHDGDDFEGDDEDFTGTGIGVGMEYKFPSGMSLRLEAMHTDYSSETMFEEVAGDGWDYDPSDTTVALGLSYYF